MRSVLVSGNFNILHPGHLRLLRFARECGDRLIVAVQSDRIADKAAHVPEALRLEGVQSNQWVDECFICDEPVTDTIARLKPDIVVKGKEHENKFNPEKAVLDSYGGSLIFSSGEAVFSSLDLLQRDFQEINLSSIEAPMAYIQRHGGTIGQLSTLAKDFSKLKICVIGDLIVDEYITCDALGMSQEDPSLVVTPIDSKKFVGGAGIVAAHAAGLGAQVKLITIGGDDDIRIFAEKALKEYHVDHVIVIDQNRPTTLKQRYRSKGKTLLRVSHLRQSAISNVLQTRLLNHLKETAEQFDLIVFSDFNYGCLPQPLVDKIIDIAHERDIMMVADSQCSSQIGNIARFFGMDLLTPTEHEARISTRNHEDGLIILAEQLREESAAKNILLKLGEEGLLIHAGYSKEETWHTDRLEALNSSPKDTAGAGDCLLITAAMTMAVGGVIWDAACLGSIAAAIQVSRVGNTPLLAHELMHELTRMSENGDVPRTNASLKQSVA